MLFPFSGFILFQPQSALVSDQDCDVSVLLYSLSYCSGFLIIHAVFCVKLHYNIFLLNIFSQKIQTKGWEKVCGIKDGIEWL